MHTTSLLLALTALGLTAAQTTSPSPSLSVTLFQAENCPSEDPVATLPADFFTDGLCHSLDGTWKSGNFLLNFTGATQRLEFFADEACTVKTLDLSNDGTEAQGQCYSTAEGWMGVTYLTYR